jgi:plasmid maintenance system killer protein
VIDPAALQMVLGVFTGWLERRERKAVASLIEENRLLRRQLGTRRLRLIDDDRRRLAARAYRVGRAALLDRLEAAHVLHDLATLPGNRFEALKGDRKGQYSIRINDQWRICFEWPERSPGPTNVEIVDYH